VSSQSQTYHNQPPILILAISSGLVCYLVTFLVKQILIIWILGWEEPNADNELLVDSGMDGSSPQVEPFGFRWYQSNPGPVPPNMETRHNPLQVSFPLPSQLKRVLQKIHFFYFLPLAMLTPSTPLQWLTQTSLWTTWEKWHGWVTGFTRALVTSTLNISHLTYKIALSNGPLGLMTGTKWVSPEPFRMRSASTLTRRKSIQCVICTKELCNLRMEQLRSVWHFKQSRLGFPNKMLLEHEMDNRKKSSITYFIKFLFVLVNIFLRAQLDLQIPEAKGDLSNYHENGEFDLLSFQATRNEVQYSCCPDEPYPDITFTITLRRRHFFYVFNLIIPCCLINGIGESHLYIWTTFE